MSYQLANEVPRSERLSQLTKQEKVIEEKKREIERRLEDKRRKEKRKAEAKVYQGEKSSEYETDSTEGMSNTGLNTFKNDGSFLEQFKKLQEIKAKQNSEGKKRQEAKYGSEERINKSKPSAIIMKLQGGKRVQQLDTGLQSKLLDDDDDDSVSPPEDQEVKTAVEKVAISVVVNGANAEELARESNINNPLYGFLNDQNGSVYQYYQKRVVELTEARRRAEKDEVNFLSHKDPGLVSYAVQVFGNTDLTPSQWKQLEDQQKMRVLYEMMQIKQKQLEAKMKAGKFQYEYDSDEEIDGGTWEHKKRKKEMDKTKDWADELTEKGKGKHHIGDFLPPDELERFMEKWDAIKEGRMPDLSDYKDYKIQSDNIGYQMLQKLGWNEGQGLGSDGSGIVAPVNKATPPVENAGFGQGRPEEIQAGDDEYEAYRKRMMLAYRFRPNPLNNPRRPYY
ncbi:SURP and G-patch domain-containing protein 1-like isoform X2 [Centruroides vittatus]|uniref:SURP and G-patch domain-containing protein 1-like isoform X2 n=1 Tax=Centruroides vittatus TaxID=120091 RepID=UPI00351099C9